MVKRKDYFGAIVMGSLWTIVCLLLNWGVWWIIKSTTDYSTASYVIPILFFCFGIYKGRDFFKAEMRTVRADDPKTDWRGFLDNLQLLCIVMVMVNSVNVFRDGFSWIGLGVFICMLAFVALSLYMKNTRFGK